MDKPLLTVLRGQRLSPPPLWLMRQAGRYLPEYRQVRAQASGFLDLCYSSALAAEVTLQPLRRFELDAAIVFADILLIADALGQRVAFEEGQGPVLEALASVDDIERLDGDRIGDHLAPVYETVQRVAAALPQVCEGATLIGFAGAPWTVAAYMIEGRGSREFGAARAWAYSEPKGFAQLMDLLVSATAEYLIGQVDAGAEVLQLFDSWAGVLSENGFRRCCIAPTAEIVRRVHEAHPEVPVIGFPRGAGPLLADYAAETGVSCVGIDTAMSATWAAAAIGPGCAVQGNLDPHALVAGGAPLDAEVDAVLEALGARPFVFNLGHGILPQTPPQHVADLVSRVRRGAAET